MTIKIGTILELTGQGYELLVDQETGQNVIAKFLDGNMLHMNVEPNQKPEAKAALERTVVTA